MSLAADLHSHSSYAGGVGHISLASLVETMRYKGIRVYGIGDCQFPAWQKQYREELQSTATGLYHYPGSDAWFIRQTEVIFTVQIEGYPHRTIAHHIILFPDDAAVQKFTLWMQQKGHKTTIARPFIVCTNQAELQDSLFAIQAIDSLVEIIPAHILTPDGVLGSKNGLQSWQEFYGDFTSSIHAAETGLSADPAMLCRIPDLQGVTFISNSDCHSTALNKVGREFTLFDTEDCSYKGIVNAIRDNKVKLTAEFHPSEGRYYLTGHRAGRHANERDVFYPDTPAKDNKCPACGKTMLTGVRDRALQLADPKLKTTPPAFQYLLPLIEVIACAMGIRSVTSRRVRSLYNKCLDVFGTEIGLWQSTPKIIDDMLDSKLPQEIIQHIIAVSKGNFSFDPPGFDGCYGILKINVE